MRPHGARPGAAPLVALLLAALLGLTACSGGSSDSSGRPTVVAAFYPLAEAVRQVTGGSVRVVDLTPAGSEPHDLEITTDQVDTIEDARLAVVMGHDFQPAVDQAVDRRDGSTVKILDELPGRLRPNDPHVWLDPVRMREIVGIVNRALDRAFPADRAAFDRRARAYEDRLRALDVQYRDGLRSCRSRLIVTAHEAFGYLASRYDLRQDAIAGISPEQEPDAARLAELTDLARREHVATIFTEELVSPRVAQTLAREAGGLKTAVLDPLETLGDRAQRAGEDYVSVMQRNLATLQRALGCRPA
jgi:zinc transport system substrate-binding protein